jgi:Ni,Fe-hydrogenase III component G
MSKFNEELNELREKYPDHVIEAWTPDDIRDTIETEITEEDIATIVGRLYDNYDANVGINWDVIRNSVYVNKNGILE